MMMLFLFLLQVWALLPEKSGHVLLQPCLSQDMAVQCRTSTGHRSLSGVFESLNRLEWCRDRGELHIYSQNVEKYSFILTFDAELGAGRWSGVGHCTSGRKVKVELEQDGAGITWVRIQYPEYRFLHIFASDAKQLEAALRVEQPPHAIGQVELQAEPG